MRLLIVPPSQSVIGSAPDTVDVYVNGVSADRQGPYWHSVVTVNNVPSPVYAEIEVLGVSTPVNPQDPPEYSISTNHVFVAQSPEVFEYDLDGNLTKDGRFNYSWNGENRLICAETRDDLPVEVPRYKVEYAYDFYGRRIQKEVFTQDNGNWALSKSSSFVCDKWNLISEISVSSTPNSSLLTTNSTSYVWGIDLSGTLQGAGGVGGLLAVIRDNGIFYPTYDANGNVSEYVDSTDTIAAHREYDSFGNTISATGDADAFSHWFSTKPWCAITSILHFELRPNKPEIGRWLNRDPIAEIGGLNLYNQLNNSVINNTDYLGLKNSPSACSRNASCPENLLRLGQNLNLVFERYKDFFNPVYISETLNDLLLPPERQYKPGRTDLRGREAWKGHLEQYEGRLTTVGTCLNILTQQLKDGKCNCCNPEYMLVFLPQIEKILNTFKANPPSYERQILMPQFPPTPGFPEKVPGLGRRIAGGALFVGAGIATVVLTFVPFDGPVGEIACGAGAMAGLKMAMATSVIIIATPQLNGD